MTNRKNTWSGYASKFTLTLKDADEMFLSKPYTTEQLSTAIEHRTKINNSCHNYQLYWDNQLGKITLIRNTDKKTIKEVFNGRKRYDYISI